MSCVLLCDSKLLVRSRRSLQSPKKGDAFKEFQLTAVKDCAVTDGNNLDR